MVKKPFGGSSWLLIFFFSLDFYDFIFAFLVWGFVMRGGLLIFLAFLVVGKGCCSCFSSSSATLPPGPVFGEGDTSLGGRGRKVLGQAFRVTQGPWVLGRSDWEPRLGRGPRASGRS